MIENRLLQRLEQKKVQLDKLRPIPQGQIQRLREQIEIEWIYNSNAIEGSTLTLRETQLILEQGLTVGGKSLREHFEVINHREAIKYVDGLVKKKTDLTGYQVRQIHQLVLKEVDDENVGKYRSTEVRIAGATHVPVEAWKISQEMQAWEAWVKGAATNHHIIEVAAMAHHRFVAIHPFVDGNGRTARLVMNVLLMQVGYPPTVIMKTNRRQYYRVLGQADNGNSKPLVNFVGRAVERSLTLYLEAVVPKDRPGKDDQWIPLREAIKGTTYSQEYLSLLARKGRLEAVKRGRVWYTTREAVKRYIESLEE